MATKRKRPAQLDPNWRNWVAVDPDFLQQMGTQQALELQNQINALAQADPRLSAGDLTRLLVETLRQQAALRGGRLDGISDQAAEFAEQLARQARGGDLAGVIEPNARQLEFQFEPDITRPQYMRPRPLEDAIDIAADEGVPFGFRIGATDRQSRNYSPEKSRVAEAIRWEGNDFLNQLRQGLIDAGIPGAELTPLSQGAYSTAYLSPSGDEVVKFTFDGPSQYTNQADGVWGTLSPRVVEEIPSNRGQFAYSVFPRADLGRATRADKDTLADALYQQGWNWWDAHEGNIGMLPGDEYRPVVIDTGDVVPDRGGRVKFPFVPPDGPIYNWLIPALAAGGATAAATLGGQQQAEAGTGRGYRPPAIPKLPPPYSPTLRGAAAMEGVPPDWYDNQMRYYYSRAINQMKKVDAEWQRLAEAGDWEAADALDAQREQFMETLESQLQEVDEGDPDYFEKSEEEGAFADAAPVEDDARGAYEEYLAGRISREDLTERLRGAFNPLGDDMGRQWGEGRRWASVNDIPEETLIDAAKDLYDSREAVRQRQRQGGFNSENMIRFLRDGALATGALTLANQSQAATMSPQGGLPQPAGEDPFFNPPQRYGYPQGETVAPDVAGQYSPVVLTSGAGGTVGPAMAASTSQGRDPDYSLAISPAEWQRWYEQTGSGYGDEDHQKFIDNVQQVMDTPLIPERYITDGLGVSRDNWAGFFPGYEGGDMTPRMLAERMPYVLLPAILSGYLQEQAEGVQDGPFAKQLMALQQPGSDEQLVKDTVAEFTGQKRERTSDAPNRAAQMILSGLESGSSGGQFAERDEVTRSEDNRLRESFAKDGKQAESEFYVTPGGQQNYRRETALQLLRTFQDGYFAPPGVTTMDWVGNRLFDQTVGNLQRAAGEEYNPREINGFGRADWRADNLMDSSAPRGRLRIANDLFARAPEWAKTSAAQTQARDAQYQEMGQTMRAVNAELERALGNADGTSPALRSAMLAAGGKTDASRAATERGYRQVNPDAIDRFDQGTAVGLANVLYNNQSFTPAQYAQWFDPILGQVNDRLSLGNDSGSFTKQMNRDLDSVRRVRGDRESQEQFDRRADWYADKKAADRDYRSAYWGPYLADKANFILGGDVTGKKFERSFLSPSADFAANFTQDFARNPYNYATIAAAGVGGGAGGLIRSGASGVLPGAASGLGRGFLAELVDEGREEAALQLGGGMFDFNPQQTNAFARDVDAPQEKWENGKPPQLDPNDADYWKKFNRAYDYHQGRAAGYYDSWKRGLLD